MGSVSLPAFSLRGRPLFSALDREGASGPCGGCRGPGAEGLGLERGVFSLWVDSVTVRVFPDPPFWGEPQSPSQRQGPASACSPCPFPRTRGVAARGPPGERPQGVAGAAQGEGGPPCGLRGVSGAEGVWVPEHNVHRRDEGLSSDLCSPGQGLP